MAVMLSDFIAKNPDICGGKPCLKGRRVRVRDVAYYSEWCSWSPDRIAESLNIRLSEVHAALTYYFENLEEIREDMQAAAGYTQELKGKVPSKLKAKLRQYELESETKSA